MNLLQMATEALQRELADFEGAPEAVVVFVFGGQDARHMTLATEQGIHLAAQGIMGGVEAFIDHANEATGGTGVSIQATEIDEWIAELDPQHDEPVDPGAGLESEKAMASLFRRLKA